MGHSSSDAPPKARGGTPSPFLAPASFLPAGVDLQSTHERTFSGVNAISESVSRGASPLTTTALLEWLKYFEKNDTIVSS